MMDNLLNDGCKELQKRVDLARNSISGKKYPNEVIPCFEWVIQTLNGFERDLYRIQKFLAFKLNDKVLQQTWYNELASINSELGVLDAYFIHPLYRLLPEDTIALRLIQWLHQSHAVTKNKPFILSNGSFSIAASENTPTLYWLPVTSQLSLLHFPLFFHEFGHQLFLYYKRELEDLIAEFQNKLSKILQPAISQSDSKYQSYIEKAADIVETWREWMEELFCDAVGLMIGGKTYLLAFSHFIRLGGLKEFFVAEKYLAKRSHPVSLLRVRFLAERSRRFGLVTEADELEEEWQAIANALGINEDYFGYFEEQYRGSINSLLDDMLTEANPKLFTELEEVQDESSYYNLTHSAWQRFISDPDGYSEWEKQKVKEILDDIQKSGG